MGFLSGLLETAGAAAPIAANMMAARNNARAQATREERQQALQLLLLKQQQEKQAVTDLLTRANARHVDAETNDLLKKHTFIRGVGGQSFDATDPNNIRAVTPAPAPKGPTPGSPDYFTMVDKVAAIKAKHAPPPQQTLAVFAGADGRPAQGVITHGPGLGRTMDLPSVNKTAGAGSANANAAMASKVNQFGEMLKKSSDLFDASDALDVGLGQSAAADIAEHGIGFRGVHIPGTQGVGSLLVNRTPEYARYQAAIDPFVLANAHALSGARINQEQAQMIKQSIERKPGDFQNPSVTKQKNKNIIDQLNSVAGSLTPEAVAEMESQMAPEQLEALRSRGYLGHPGARKSAPQSAPSAPKSPTGKRKSLDELYNEVTGRQP